MRRNLVNLATAFALSLAASPGCGSDTGKKPNFSVDEDAGFSELDSGSDAADMGENWDIGDTGETGIDSGIESPCPEVTVTAIGPNRTRVTEFGGFRSGEPVDFQAEVTPAEEVVRWEWETVTERAATFTPSTDVANPTVTFDELGRHVVSATAYFESGPCPSTTGRFAAHVATFSGVTIELRWWSADRERWISESTADLDLHFLHENGQWNMEPWDIFFFNDTADWGDTGPSGDPYLTANDFGPNSEVIRVADLEERVTYRIGAYYFADMDDEGAVAASVRVYSEVDLVFEYEAELATPQTFWEVGLFTGTPDPVIAVDRVGEGFP